MLYDPDPNSQYPTDPDPDSEEWNQRGSGSEALPLAHEELIFTFASSMDFLIPALTEPCNKRILSKFEFFVYIRYPGNWQTTRYRYTVSAQFPTTR